MSVRIKILPLDNKYAEAFMRVLLTGGAGYIGSHVAVELLGCGHDVAIVDNYSNSSPVVVKKIEDITGRIADVFELDLTDAAQVDGFFGAWRPDAVVHLAGFKAVGESVGAPLLYYRNNLDCTLALMEAMIRHDVGKVIFSSSATVYGAANVPPYTEDMDTGKCSNPYGSTKMMIEQIITDTAAASGMSAVILRYFNPVGAHPSGLIGEEPRGTPNNLMPFITQVATGRLAELSVFGNDYPTRDGTCIRDYIHVVDLAKGHVKALGYDAGQGGTEIFNLGTGNGCSVLELADAFESANGVKIPRRMAPRRAGDLPIAFADVSKASRLMGWSAELSIADMCRDAYNHARM